MSQQLLLFADKGAGEVVVLEVCGEDVDQLFIDNGRDFGNWPEDLGAYRLDYGLWVWEGQVDDDIFSGGEFRRLMPDEQAKLLLGERCLGE